MIRKVLGYALTDVQANDLRVNWESTLLSETAGTPSFDDFAAHLDVKDPAAWSQFNTHGIRQYAQTHTGHALDRCVVHASEGDPGLPGVMVLVPPSLAAEWIQNDNIFDYVEAHLGDQPDTEPTLREIRGIYPYDGLWMDKLTGLELHPGQVSRFFRMIEQKADPLHLLAAARKITPFSPWEDAGDPAQPLFKDAGTAADRLARLVPAEIQELAAMGKLFTSPDTWKSLRPVLYTYWS